MNLRTGDGFAALELLRKHVKASRLQPGLLLLNDCSNGCYPIHIHPLIQTALPSSSPATAASTSSSSSYTQPLGGNHGHHSHRGVLRAQRAETLSTASPSPRLQSDLWSTARWLCPGGIVAARHQHVNGMPRFGCHRSAEFYVPSHLIWWQLEQLTFVVRPSLQTKDDFNKL